MTFSYKAYTADGARERGLIEAADAREASRLLLERGLFARSVAPVRAKRAGGSAARAAFYRELGALLSSGMELDRALVMLAEQTPGDSERISKAADAVRAGKSPVAALVDSGLAVGSFERAALSAAETSATLPDTLVRVAGEIEREEDAAAKRRGALVYPCFVAALGLIVAFVMLGVIVPKTAATLAGAGMELPASSKAILTGARVVAFILAPLAALAAAAFAAAVARARRDRAFALKLDGFLLRLPGADVARLRASQRFASVLSTLVSGGTPVPDALPVAGEASGHVTIEDGAAAAASRVRSGGAPAAAISSVPVAGPALASWIRVGETSGRLPEMLDSAAARLRERADRALAARLALLEPVLLAAVGLFVLLLALALLLPVLDLSAGL